MKITRREAVAMFAAPVASKGPSLAITIDDVHWQNFNAFYLTSADDQIRRSLGKHRAALFAVGNLVNNEIGRGILKSWSKDGHIIGNHTWSHVPITNMKPEEFEQDILRNDQLLRNYPSFAPFFRFPMLKEGNTAEVRDRLRGFLHAHGYRNGEVTIDTSDWYYDEHLRSHSSDPGFNAGRYRDPYLAHLWDRAQYYDGLSNAVLGRSVRHTILLHYNMLNMFFLADVLKMFTSHGWTIIDAAEAFEDPVFRMEPKTVPAGESLIWALAKESGKFEGKLRYPGENGAYEKDKLDRLAL